MLEQHRLRRENKDAALKQYEFRFITKSGKIEILHILLMLFPGQNEASQH